MPGTSQNPCHLTFIVGHTKYFTVKNQRRIQTAQIIPSENNHHQPFPDWKADSLIKMKRRRKTPQILFLRLFISSQKKKLQ